MKAVFLVILFAFLMPKWSTSQVTHDFSERFKADSCGCLGVRMNYIQDDTARGVVLINGDDIRGFVLEKVIALLGKANRQYTFPAEAIAKGLRDGDVSLCYDLLCNEQCGAWDESSLVLEIVFLENKVKSVVKFEPEEAPILVPGRD